MRYRKIVVAGSCVFFTAICTLENHVLIQRAVAQDADPFGGSSVVQQSVQQPTDKIKTITRHSAKIDQHLVSFSTRLSDETRKRLREPITIDYIETPFSDIESELEDRLGVNIVLDQSAKDDSLSPDEPISIQFRDVPGNYALRLMLGEKNATYFVQAGVIRIISVDDADDPTYFVRKVFEVDDLLAAINRWNHLHDEEPAKPDKVDGPASPTAETPGANHSPRSSSRVIVRATASAGQFGGGGGGKGGAAISQRFNEPSSVLRLTRAGNELTNLIQQSVDQDQWMDFGSGEATMSLVCGQLVVFGSETLVNDVDELLSDLRAKVISD